MRRGRRCRGPSRNGLTAETEATRGWRRRSGNLGLLSRSSSWAGALADGTLVFGTVRVLEQARVAHPLPTFDGSVAKCKRRLVLELLGVFGCIILLVLVGLGRRGGIWTDTTD